MNEQPNCTIIFKDPPIFRFDEEIMQELQDTGNFNDGIELISMVVDGDYATVVVRPVKKERSP